MWESYEEDKMIVKDGQPYYLIEFNWFQSFCAYIGINEDSKM